MSIYRNDTKDLELKLEPIDLTETCSEDSANQVAGAACHRQIQIIVRHGDSGISSIAVGCADAFQLQRVLMNLLFAAINHSRRGDRVEVVLESNGFQQIVKF
jgi:two-component system NarL family sensor kinase